MRTFLNLLAGLVGIIALGIIALFLWQFHQMNQSTAERCAILRNSLLAKIDGAKEVRVIEHSSRWDYSDNAVHPEKIYTTIVLNADEKNRLKAALIPSQDRSATTFHSCIFEPHHRIEFVNPDNGISTVEICFVCGELDIGNGQRILPDGWDTTLKNFISSLHLRPDGPWHINETGGSH